MNRSDLNAVWVGGVRTLTTPASQVLDALTADVRNGSRRVFVFTPNIQHVDLLRRNARFRAAYEHARYVLPDGWPVAMVASVRSRSRVRRVAGSDFMWQALDVACAEGWRLSLIGGAPGSADEVRRRLIDRGHSPASIQAEPAPVRLMTDPAERRALVARVSAHQPHLVLLSFGAPRQEIFASEDLAEADVGAVLCIGAGLDFAAGRIRRAPAIMQRAGLEWAWRLVLEPGRLGPRYARAMAGFLGGLRQRGGASSGN